MRELCVVIREDGSMVCLDTPMAPCFKAMGKVTTRRASHVEPENGFLRIVFHILRSVFGDKGWMATFTRYWPCLWRVNTYPTGGPILPGRWRGRQEAIDMEIAWLNQNLE